MDGNKSEDYDEIGQQHEEATDDEYIYADDYEYVLEEGEEDDGKSVISQNPTQCHYSSTRTTLPCNFAHIRFFDNQDNNQELFDFICEEVEEIHELTGEALSTSFLLLRAFQWNKKILVNRYLHSYSHATHTQDLFELAKIKIISDLNITSHKSQLRKNIQYSSATSSYSRNCPICCDTVEKNSNPLVSIGCVHMCCLNCLTRFWSGYLLTSPTDERSPDPLALRCIHGSDCPFIAHPLLVIEVFNLSKQIQSKTINESLVTEAKSTNLGSNCAAMTLGASLNSPSNSGKQADLSRECINAYKKWLTKLYASTAPGMAQCPNPNCSRYMCRRDIISPFPTDLLVSTITEETSATMCVMSTCLCERNFCIGCLNEENHSPATCEAMHQWATQEDAIVQGVELDIELRETLEVKQCPNCKQGITRVSGCNHIRCGGCYYEFCWICMQHCPRHRHPQGGCNKVSEVVTGLDDTRLHQFEHFRRRYKAHHDSCKLEAVFFTRVAELFDRVADDAELLQEARDVLQKCRRCLKYTYVLAYSLFTSSRFSELALFECHQQDLENHTERLSRLVESAWQTPLPSFLASSGVAKNRNRTKVAGSGNIIDVNRNLESIAKRSKTSSNTITSSSSAVKPTVPVDNILSGRVFSNVELYIGLSHPTRCEERTTLLNHKMAAERFVKSVLDAATCSTDASLSSFSSKDAGHCSGNYRNSSIVEDSIPAPITLSAPVPHISWYCAVCKAPRRECACSVQRLIDEGYTSPRGTIENAVQRFLGDYEKAEMYMRNLERRDPIEGDGFDAHHNWWVGVGSKK